MNQPLNQRIKLYWFSLHRETTKYCTNLYKWETMSTTGYLNFCKTPLKLCVRVNVRSLLCQSWAAYIHRHELAKSFQSAILSDLQ